MGSFEQKKQDPWGCPCETNTRTDLSLYPDFTAEIEAIKKAKGITAEILKKIIAKHLPNSSFNRSLYRRYMGVDVPIYHRSKRFEDDPNAINNKINNDFFGDIVNFFTGYFAGKPIGYSYSVTQESEDDTGSKEAVEEASKALTDFVTRNNMMDVDMETAKYAAVCGYAARLFYHDSEGSERVLAVPPYEAAILSETDITEPFAAVRYFPVADLDGKVTWHAEYYDADKIVFFRGDSAENLTLQDKEKHLYDFCPLQGIPKNGEMMGDAEKALLAIDAYDRALSDANNDVEAFAHAYMIFEGQIDDEEITRGQKAGAFRIPPMSSAAGSRGPVYFLTKDVNDAFMEHHLDRLEKNIYRFSNTPNLTDENFSQNSSGVALKFKLLGMETKCGIFQAKMTSAGTYMFKLLASSWAKRKISADPLQCSMEFHRNFPLDLASEAQAVQALISAGLPERVAFAQLSFIEDVDWVMQMIEAEKDGIPDLPKDGASQDAGAREEIGENPDEGELNLDDATLGQG
ncbi:phage portal protein [Ruminococcaceae bacterium OttesenSCG-928-I18]|nr:phage portal protein [Ruminococcaceae bacterium OttesenSCG-928-I18]